jgi:DNA-binding NarL/FixJ family response regulator
MGDKIRLLIADDHPLMREAIHGAFLNQPDMEVVSEASDGEEAVRLCAQYKPDVVILDIVMPKMSGIEATREIVRECPETSVLILTAYDDDRYVIGLLEAGAAGYLLKTARGHAIVDAVRTVHQGESVMHPMIIAKMLKYSVQTQVDGGEKRAGERLSDRELEILKLAARGMSNKEIARELFLSTRTVKAHLSSVFSKMNVTSRTEAIIKGAREGVISLDGINGGKPAN